MMNISLNISYQIIIYFCTFHKPITRWGNMKKTSLQVVQLWHYKKMTLIIITTISKTRRQPLCTTADLIMLSAIPALRILTTKLATVAPPPTFAVQSVSSLKACTETNCGSEVRYCSSMLLLIFSSVAIRCRSVGCNVLANDCISLSVMSRQRQCWSTLEYSQSVSATQCLMRHSMKLN